MTTDLFQFVRTKFAFLQIKAISLIGVWLYMYQHPHKSNLWIILYKLSYRGYIKKQPPKALAVWSETMPGKSQILVWRRGWLHWVVIEFCTDITKGLLKRYYTRKIRCIPFYTKIVYYIILGRWFLSMWLHIVHILL